MQNDKKKKEGYRDQILTITSKMTTTKSYLYNLQFCNSSVMLGISRGVVRKPNRSW